MEAFILTFVGIVLTLGLLSIFGILDFDNDNNESKDGCFAIIVLAFIFAIIYAIIRAVTL